MRQAVCELSAGFIAGVAAYRFGMPLLLKAYNRIFCKAQVVVADVKKDMK